MRTDFSRVLSVSRLTGLFFVFVVASLAELNGQELQRSAYTFLHVAPNARNIALGGVNVSLADIDPNGFISNPALTGDTLSGFASANYQFYPGDIGHAAFAYSPEIGKIGVVSFGIQHFSYGTIKAYDITGAELGDFSASETALVISRQHEIRNFRLGVSLKPVFSSLAGFRSTALLFDLGGLFIHPTRQFNVGLVVKNLGFILNDYSESSDSSVPFDVRVGASFKPEHMPVRFSLTAYRLVESDQLEYQGNTAVKPEVLDNVFRRLTFGTEILLHRNVNVLLGYNYGMRQELKLENAGGSSGFSLGFSARVKAFEFVVSRSSFVAGSPAYAFTLSSDIKKLMKRI